MRKPQRDRIISKENADRSKGPLVSFGGARPDRQSRLEGLYRGPAIEALLIEKGIVTKEEIDAKSREMAVTAAAKAAYALR